MTVIKSVACLTHRVLACATLAAVYSLACAIPTAFGADPHAAHRQAMHSDSGASATSVNVPSVLLRDSHDREFQFDTKAFGERVVIIDFVYTSCTTICPTLTATLAATRNRLKTYLGSQITLVSVSVDPNRDTPPKLRAYADQFKAGDNWLWLTGNKGQIDRVLRAFGLSTGAPQDHPPVILVGMPAADKWLRWVGIPPVEALVDEAIAMVDHNKDERHATSSAALQH